MKASFDELIWMYEIISSRELINTNTSLSYDKKALEKPGSKTKKSFVSSLLSFATDRRILSGNPPTLSKLLPLIHFNPPAKQINLNVSTPNIGYYITCASDLTVTIIRCRTRKPRVKRSSFGIRNYFSIYLASINCR